MTKFFYDTEFVEIGPKSPVSLISIGIVAESGQEYYAVNADMPEGRIKREKWLMDNVWPYLPTKRGENGRACRCRFGHLDKSSPLVKSRETIAAEIAVFVSTAGSPDRRKNELWAWYGAYDHVVLAQSYGRMIDLPECIPMFTCDLKQEHVRQGSPELPEQGSAQHNALADARHNVEIAKVLGVL